MVNINHLERAGYSFREIKEAIFEESFNKLQGVLLPPHGGSGGNLHVDKEPVVSTKYLDYDSPVYNVRIYASCPDREECGTPLGAFNNWSGQGTYKTWDLTRGPGFQV